MNDLATATGMAKPGLYDCFGDKNALYARALKLYFQEYGDPGLDDVRTSGDPLANVLRRFLENVAKAAGNPECPGGCFVVNSTIACTQTSGKVHELTQEIIRYRSEILTERILAAKENDELPKEADHEALATYFAGQATAIAVMAREGADAHKLQQFIDIAMRVLPGESVEQTLAS